MTLKNGLAGRLSPGAKVISAKGRVSDLAVTDNSSLLAWVAGSERYATRVVMDEDDLLIATPYADQNLKAKCDRREVRALMI